MNENRKGRRPIIGAVLVFLLGAVPVRAQDARQIVDEAQRRTRSNSERYEGVLQVINDKGKIAD